MQRMYGDLDRPPLRAGALNRALEQDGFRLEVLDATTSTNAVVAERARAGEPHGLVVVAEEQTQGRGRLDRSWLSPPRAGLTFSMLIRPTGPLSWVPLLAGVGVAQALRRQCEVDAVLKWPNDVLLVERKVCGLLAEAGPEMDGAVVLGIGLNVTTRRDELPVAEATSLALEGATTTDRRPLAAPVRLAELASPPAAGPPDPLPDPPASVAMILAGSQSSQAGITQSRNSKVGEIEIDGGDMVISGVKTVQVEIKE